MGLLRKFVYDLWEGDNVCRNLASWLGNHCALTCLVFELGCELLRWATRVYVSNFVFPMYEELNGFIHTMLYEGNVQYDPAVCVECNSNYVRQTTEVLRTYVLWGD